MPPWYGEVARWLKPIDGHETVVLLAIAAVTVVIALKADPAQKMIWIIYLLLP